MNIFELAFAFSLLVGLILGAIYGAPFGALGIALGAVSGLALGFTCYFLVFGMSRGLAKVGRSMEAPPSNPLLFVTWWMVNFTSVMLMILAPLATVAVLFLLRKLLFLTGY